MNVKGYLPFPVNGKCVHKCECNLQLACDETAYFEIVDGRPHYLNHEGWDGEDETWASQRVFCPSCGQYYYATEDLVELACRETPKGAAR